MTGPFARLDGHEQVIYGADAESGLRCIIAISSTALGPALGGTRFYPYASEGEALTDVLRLSRAMTFKAAVAGLDVGGTQFADGSRSVALLLSTDGSAGLGVPLVTELEGLAGGEFEARFTVDANGELSRLRIGVVTEGGFGLTRGRENVNAALREGRRGAQRLSQSDRTVFGYELELDDPALRDAASRFLQQAPRAGADLAVGDRAALRAAAADLWSGAEPFSTITVREHSDDDAGAGFAGKLGLLGVLRGGASGDATLNSTELVAAHYWDTTNGGWVRDDTACLGP